MSSMPRRALIVVGSLGVALLLVPTVWAQEDDDAQVSIVLEGSVTLNGDQAPPNMGLIVRNKASNEQCGSTTVQESGRYAVTLLVVTCPVDSEVTVAARATGDVAAGEPTRVVPGINAKSIEFTVSDESAQRIRAAALGQQAQAASATDISAIQETESVFEQVEDMLRWLLIYGGVALVAIVLAKIYETRRRYDYLKKCLEVADKAGDASGEDVAGSQFGGVFRWLVEGVVLSFVVVALIALGASGKITQEGIVSVLAAMVGYAAGRATSA